MKILYIQTSEITNDLAVVQ